MCDCLHAHVLIKRHWIQPVVLEMALGIRKTSSDPLELRKPRDLVQLTARLCLFSDLHSVILHPIVCLLVMKPQVSANLCVPHISLSLPQVNVAILVLDPLLRLYSNLITSTFTSELVVGVRILISPVELAGR